MTMRTIPIRFRPFPPQAERQRILVTISHFYRPTREGRYGSTREGTDGRRRALERVIASLHQTVAAPTALVHGPSHGFIPANSSFGAEIKVVVCTTGDDHLLDGVTLPAGSFEQHRTTAEPMLLGFECHAVLRDHLGRFDEYWFLEDDIVVEDPLFAPKLRWFRSIAGDDAALQPNRFETTDQGPLNKLYIDGDPAHVEKLGLVPEVGDRTWVSGEFLGRTVWFRRVVNPHSGCFFLSAAQMARWAARPDFLSRDSAFVGPLESAATLGLMRTFRVYKPGRDDAAFLEVRHGHNRYLGALLRFV